MLSDEKAAQFSNRGLLLQTCDPKKKHYNQPEINGACDCVCV